MFCVILWFYCCFIKATITFWEMILAQLRGESVCMTVCPTQLGGYELHSHVQKKKKEDLLYRNWSYPDTLKTLVQDEMTAASKSSHLEVHWILPLYSSQSSNGTWVCLSSHKGSLLCFVVLPLLVPTHISVQMLNPFQWKTYWAQTTHLWLVFQL